MIRAGAGETSTLSCVGLLATSYFAGLGSLGVSQTKGFRLTCCWKLELVRRGWSWSPQTEAQAGAGAGAGQVALDSARAPGAALSLGTAWQQAFPSAGLLVPTGHVYWPGQHPGSSGVSVALKKGQTVMHWGRTLWSVLRRDRGLCHLLSQVDRWMHPKSGGLMDARMHPGISAGTQSGMGQGSMRQLEAGESRGC